MKILRIAVCFIFILTAGIFGYLKFTSKKDDTVPVISCDRTELTISVKDGEKELLGYVTASDDKDGDLTSQVFIENMTPLISSGRTDITYVVCDSDNHVSRLTLPAYYSDYHAPRFTVKQPLIVPLRMRGFTFDDYIGIDDSIDGSVLSQNLIYVTDFDLSTPGTYSLTVKATNSRYDSSSIGFTVQVVDAPEVSPVRLSRYIVYCEPGDRLDFRSYLRETEETEVHVDTAGVDLSAPGVYEVVYRAEDRDATRLVVVCGEDGQ